MKKFISASMICVLLISLSSPALASSNLERFGETVLIEVLNTVIHEALRRNGRGDLIPGLESSDEDVPTRSLTRPSGEITELSDEQYQTLSEICLAGSLEEFRKKIEYENISPEAKYTKSDGTVITLLEIAKTSPNPELTEFLTGSKQDEAAPESKQEQEKEQEEEIKTEGE